MPFAAFRTKARGREGGGGRQAGRNWCAVSEKEEMDTSPSKTLSPSSSGSGKIHLGEGMALSGLRRALSQVSMLVVKATTSGETAWREELQKYVDFHSHSFFLFFSMRFVSARNNEFEEREKERKKMGTLRSWPRKRGGTSKGLIFRFLPKTLAVYKANGDRRIQFTMADCYPPRNEEMTESRTTTNGRVKSS